MQKLVMFNGPPRAGKDTAGEICRGLIDKGATVAFVKFTTAVKDATHAEYGLEGAADTFEALKDTPLKEFRGLTPRQAYIDKSERLRAEHGHDIVARMLVDRVRELDADIVINTDLGMDYEAEHLVRYFGAENTSLVRLHRDGHTFEGDCRYYVYRDDVASSDVVNSTVKELTECLAPVIADAMAGVSEPRMGLA
ncbi:hypothetical protein [Salipiger sp. PrR003]|uniref:hypothetical protein n=1 Tax=Salipiger sp. PrR003 TaxID=2706776 RepID=UPI0013D91B94|nr:hypothetical protein [Salipiger sp. PrR003]NDV52797.1 hypothetical protein [Salipiger sp. PrR003]